MMMKSMKISPLATASIAPDAVLAFKPNPQEKVIVMNPTPTGTTVAVANAPTTNRIKLGTQVFPSNIQADKALVEADADIFPALDAPVELYTHHAPNKMQKAFSCMSQLLLLQQQAESIQTLDLLVIPAHQNATTFYRSNDIVTTTGINLEGLDDLLLKAIEQKALSIQQTLAEVGVTIDVYELLGIPSYAG